MHERTTFSIANKGSKSMIKQSYNQKNLKKATHDTQ